MRKPPCKFRISGGVCGRGLLTAASCSPVAFPVFPAPQSKRLGVGSRLWARTSPRLSSGPGSDNSPAGRSVTCAAGRCDPGRGGPSDMSERGEAATGTSTETTPLWTARGRRSRTTGGTGTERAPVGGAREEHVATGQGVRRSRLPPRRREQWRSGGDER